MELWNSEHPQVFFLNEVMARYGPKYSFLLVSEISPFME